MRKVLCTLTLAVLLTLTTKAQFFYPLGIGVSIAGKLSVNAGDIPEGQKTELGIVPLPDFMASAWYIVSQREDFGFALDVGYSTNAFIMKPYQNATDETKVRSTMNYLMVQPYIRFKLFNIGVGFGIPLGGKRSNLSGSFSEDLNTEDLATAIELKLKLDGPVYRDATGRVHLFALFSYQLNGVYSDDRPNNPKVAFAGLGISYYFHFRLWEY